MLRSFEKVGTGIEVADFGPEREQAIEGGLVRGIDGQGVFPGVGGLPHYVGIDAGKFVEGIAKADPGFGVFRIQRRARLKLLAASW